VLRVETLEGTAVFSSSHALINEQNSLDWGPQTETYHIEIPQMFLMP
jgi:hypothetical protein